VTARASDRDVSSAQTLKYKYKYQVLRHWLLNLYKLLSLGVSRVSQWRGSRGEGTEGGPGGPGDGSAEKLTQHVKSVYNI